MILHDYEFDPQYKTSVAYFSMEFAIHQALKIYAGGLGFLAGSHMRSAYDLRQNVVGVGILWSYGYYDQARHTDRSLKAEFIRKQYYFLEDLGVQATVKINSQDVH
ncbi:MAG: alpha-glucan family phosphorylase, partial [Sulfurimonadaceae bacterium]